MQISKVCAACRNKLLECDAFHGFQTTQLLCQSTIGMRYWLVVMCTFKEPEVIL